jgi:hypothetical protein
VSFAYPGANGIVFAGADDKPQKKITFNAGAEFATDFRIDDGVGFAAGSVAFNVRGKAPVKFSYAPSLDNFDRIESGVIPGEENEGRIELSPPEGTKLDKYLYYKNATIRPSVTIGTQATFAGKTDFEKDVTFGVSSIEFGTEGTDSELIVKGAATLKDTINFGTASYNINKLVFGTTGLTFNLGTASSADNAKATRTIGEAVFTEGSYTDIGTQGILISGIKFEADDDSEDGTASVIVPPDVTVTIGGNKIEVKGGDAQLINTVVTLNNGQSINPVGSESKLVFYEGDGLDAEEPSGIRITGVLGRTGEFKVTGGSAELNSGKLTGLNNGVTVTFNKDTELIVPLQSTLEIGTASLDLSKGSIVLGGTEAGAGAGSYSAIKLINGTLSTGSPKNKKAYGGDAYIIAGSTGSSGVPMALIGSASDGAWGTWSSNIINSSVVFIGTTGLLTGSSSAFDNPASAEYVGFGDLN